MVARGDLGLEMPLERVPRVQNDIIRQARRARHAGDSGDPGARVDDPRAAADARRGERRGQRGRRGRRRHHARRRNGGRRFSRARRADAGCHHSRGRESVAPTHAASPPRGAAIDRHHDHARALCAAAVTLANRGDARAIVAVTRGGSTAQLCRRCGRAPRFSATTARAIRAAPGAPLGRGARVTSTSRRMTNPPGNSGSSCDSRPCAGRNGRGLHQHQPGSLAA